VDAHLFEWVALRNLHVPKLPKVSYLLAGNAMSFADEGKGLEQWGDGLKNDSVGYSVKKILS